MDGMGGGIGADIVARAREKFGDRIEILALGTNSNATERMLRAGADRGASGENAIKVSASLGEYILGPIGIVVPNALLGEISPEVAAALLAAPAERILVPVNQEHFSLAGLDPKPLGRLVEDAVALLAERLARKGEVPSSPN